MTFIYIASPYSDPDEKVRETRYLQASHYLSFLLSRRQWAYSPIVHCHNMAKVFRLPTDAAFWAEYNFAMLEAAREMHVLQLKGWERSVGVSHEIAFCRTREKTVTTIGWGTPNERQKSTSVS